MPDYGHELAFGTFITPPNERPAGRRRARAADRAGRARPRDVPGPPVPAGVPRHLDAADVGGRADASASASRRNVLNLPLRPPAVLARAAASLDLLSGGRFELGLGAGAFWDAIVAMGGPKLTPGQAVDALDEAIDVIRGIWDADDAPRRPRRRRALPRRRRQARPGAGARHPDLARRLQAADAAAHRRARPTAGCRRSATCSPATSRRGNATIDEAAREAGRDPREIRRLLNIGGRPTVRPSSGSTSCCRSRSSDGVSTFILASDDPRDDRALRRRRSRPRCARRSRRARADGRHGRRGGRSAARSAGGAA